MRPGVLDPDAVTADVIPILQKTWQDDLISIVAYGSWVHGDFEPSRSDVDLLAVVRDDPTQDQVDALATELEDVFQRHPQWIDRIELGVVSRAAVADVLHDRDSKRLVGRLSPGESLNLAPAERRRLLDWEAAERGRTVHGTPGVLPAAPSELVRAVLLEELTSWPVWIEEVTGDEPLAYAVLTACRSVAYASTGKPHSKRAGGRWVSEHAPNFQGLLDRAETVWYQPDAEVALERRDVLSFIQEWLPTTVQRLTESER